MTDGDRGSTDIRSSRQPSGSGRLQPNIAPSTGNGSARSHDASGIDLNLKGNAALIWAGAAILLIAAAVSVGLFASPGPDPTPNPQTPVSTAGASLMQPIGPSEIDQAIARLMMSAPEKDKVRAELADGKLRLAAITVSDSDEEDGDWVRISGAGFQQDVRIFHKPYTVSVPYLPGMPVSVIGLVDGGGGDITVAVYVGAARLSLKPLKAGEVLQIPTP